MTEPLIGDADFIRQILVHPVVWPDLVGWLAARNIALERTQFDPDDIPTYTMAPMDWPPEGRGPMTIYHLPLVGHDLPEYQPNDPPPAPWRRVKVFYDPETQRWNWVHTCPWHEVPAMGHRYYSLKIAYMYATEHLRSCL